MFSLFFKSRRFALWAWGGLVVLVLSLVLQTRLNVAINDWYKTFYDLMQNASSHKVEEFLGGNLALFEDRDALCFARNGDQLFCKPLGFSLA